MDYKMPFNVYFTCTSYVSISTVVKLKINWSLFFSNPARLFEFTRLGLAPSQQGKKATIMGSNSEPRESEYLWRKISENNRYC